MNLSQFISKILICYHTYGEYAHAVGIATGSPYHDYYHLGLPVSFGSRS
jgi:hypothetical protein